MHSAKKMARGAGIQARPPGHYQRSETTHALSQGSVLCWSRVAPSR